MFDTPSQPSPDLGVGKKRDLAKTPDTQTTPGVTLQTNHVCKYESEIGTKRVVEGEVALLSDEDDYFRVIPVKQLFGLGP